MSVQPFPGPFPATVTHALAKNAGRLINRIPARPLSQFVRRRPTLAQGRALELLGHAVEYLVDQQLYRDQDDAAAAADAAAIDLLMCLSREVFAECREIFPERRSLRSRLLRLLMPNEDALIAKL